MFICSGYTEGEDPNQIGCWTVYITYHFQATLAGALEYYNQIP